MLFPQIAAAASNLPLVLPRGSSTPASPHDPFPSSSPLLCLLLSPDANLVATGDAAGVVRILAPFQPRVVAFRQAAPVTATAFVPPLAPEGCLPRLVTAGHRKLFVWAIDEGRVERAIARHSARPTLLATSPDGEVLASCAADRQLILWGTATWACLASFDLRYHVTCLALGPGSVFAACDPRVADFTALAPNACLSRLLEPPRPVSEARCREAPELFKTKAEAIAGAFSGAGRAAESEVCRLL